MPKNYFKWGKSRAFNKTQRKLFKIKVILNGLVAVGRLLAGSFVRNAEMYLMMGISRLSSMTIR